LLLNVFANILGLGIVRVKAALFDGKIDNNGI
jgi:hypothetical protein